MRMLRPDMTRRRRSTANGIVINLTTTTTMGITSHLLRHYDEAQGGPTSPAAILTDIIDSGINTQSSEPELLNEEIDIFLIIRRFNIIQAMTFPYLVQQLRMMVSGGCYHLTVLLIIARNFIGLSLKGKGGRMKILFCNLKFHLIQNQKKKKFFTTFLLYYYGKMLKNLL